MIAARKPRHPDLIAADAALERAAQRALEIARQTGTACWVLRDGKIVDLAADPAPPGKPRAKRPTEARVR